VGEKELEQKLTELETTVKEAATKEAKADAAKEIKAFEEKHKDAIEGYATLKASVEKLKNDAELNQEVIDDFVRLNKGITIPANQKPKTFNEILGEAIEKNANAIKGFKKGSGSLTIDLMPDYKETNKEGLREVKAVGDMSISANFSSANNFYQDVRTNNLIEKPYNRVWLGDILPGGVSNGTSILYPKENGGEGGAALWTDPTQDKAQMDFDLTSQSAFFKWIAGYVIIAREMLDDIPFLTSYLQNKMLISLKIAENDFILNGSSDTNPVTGLLDAATAYDGTFTKPVDRIIDAGWGQVVEDTFEFYSPTTTILTPRDAVAIGLNKSDGSQEYDLPAGSVAFVNGQLVIGGLDVARTTQIGTGNFLTFDKMATMFIKRMQPELRMIEDATLAKKNKIMFRVEERATLAIFNNNALVTGTLASEV
jgi:HK97 family phage major capsid protein